MRDGNSGTGNRVTGGHLVKYNPGWLQKSGLFIFLGVTMSDFSLEAKISIMSTCVQYVNTLQLSQTFSHIIS